MKGNSTHGQAVGLLGNKLTLLYHERSETSKIKDWSGHPDSKNINLTTGQMQTLDSHNKGEGFYTAAANK